MKIKITAFALLIAMIFTLFSACGGNTESKDDLQSTDKNPSETEYGTVDFSFAPLAAGQEKLLYDNPDRGFRTEMVFTIYDKHPDPENEGKYTNHCDLINADGTSNKQSKCRGKHDIRDLYANLPKEDISEIIEYIFKIYFPERAECQSKLALVFIGFPDYNKGDLPDNCMTVLQMLCDRFRKQEARMLWRHSYCSPWLDWSVSEENKNKLQSECADQKTMFRHIEQLAPFFKKNIDVIHKFSSGFIGNGEFTEAWQWPPIDTNALIKKVLETWCVPNNLYYTVRVPSFKLRLAEAEPEYEYLSLIGNNNDAIFGEQTYGGWNSGCFQKSHNDTMHKTACTNGSGHIANGWWEYMYETAAYTPQSGEMYVNSNHLATKRVPTGMEVILELARHRYTCFSQWHCFLEKTDGSGVIQGWIDKEKVTPETLQKESVLYDPAWFVNEKGKTVGRNPYEFIRDHLGYKITLEKLTVTDNFTSGATVDLALSLKNYGFAAAFNMYSGFAVLDSQYNPVCTVEAGEPNTWYSHDPEDHLDDNPLTHSIEAKVKLPEDSGKYYLAFYLKNSADEPAKTSNNTEYKNGFNLLCEVEVK